MVYNKDIQLLTVGFIMNPFSSLKDIVPSHHLHHLDFNADDSALYKNNPHLKREMEKYCQYCGVSHDEIKQFITMAENEIVPQLSDETKPMPTGDRETVLALMWYLTAQTCLTKEQHLRGAMRIEDETGRIVKYMEESLKDDPYCPVYHRISTHMNEYGVVNNGVEFEEGQLPGQNKKNILFMYLPGNEKLHTHGTTYIKFEDAGLPPFWKSGFRSYENFARFNEHAINYLKSRVEYEQTPDYQARRENVPQSYRQRFDTAIKQIYAAKARLPLDSLQDLDLENENENAPTKILKEASRFGISRMIHVLEKEIRDSANREIDGLTEAKQLLQELKQREEEARLRGYRGDIKGSEAVLPSLKNMVQGQQ